MSAFNYTLYDQTGDLLENEFTDLNHKVAYQVRSSTPSSPPPTPSGSSSSTIVEIRRAGDWGYALEHEPWQVALSFGGSSSTGRVQLGQKIFNMADMLRQKIPGSSTRYFTGTDGQEYRWKPASRRLECFDKNGGMLAVYEYLLDSDAFAKLEIKPEGWSMSTELVATLILNRFAIRYNL